MLWDRLAVAAHGCQTHTQRAAAQAAWSRRADCASRGPWRRLPYRRSNGQAVVVAQQRWVAKWSTGGHAEQASNAARGTPEKRRTCGTDIRTAFVPRGAKVRGSFGTPASRATLTFGLACRLHKTRAQMRRENDGRCVVSEWCGMRCRALAIPPRQGRDRRVHGEATEKQ